MRLCAYSTANEIEKLPDSIGDLSSLESLSFSSMLDCIAHSVASSHHREQDQNDPCIYGTPHQSQHSRCQRFASSQRTQCGAVIVMLIVVTDNPLDSNQAIPVLQDILLNNPNLKPGKTGLGGDTGLLHSISNSSVLDEFALVGRIERLRASGTQRSERAHNHDAVRMVQQHIHQYRQERGSTFHLCCSTRLFLMQQKKIRRKESFQTTDRPNDKTLGL
jgi:hypothetical protein